MVAIKLNNSMDEVHKAISELLDKYIARGERIDALEAMVEYLQDGGTDLEAFKKSLAD